MVKGFICEAESKKVLKEHKVGKYFNKKFLETIKRWRKEEEKKMDKAETEGDHKYHEGRITMIDDVESLYEEDEEPGHCP